MPSWWGPAAWELMRRRAPLAALIVAGIVATRRIRARGRKEDKT